MSEESEEAEGKKLVKLILTRNYEKKDTASPTSEDLRKIAEILAGFCGYSGDLDRVVAEVEEAVDVRMELGAAITDDESQHDEKWVQRVDAEGVYTKAYHDLLQYEKVWPSILVKNLHRESKKVLSLLKDPLFDGNWKRMGMVIGHVQSGKTANYLSVLTQAADAGYKFIVIIAGTQNALRKQTQLRIDEGFIGRTHGRDKRPKLIGVGIGENYPCPASLTTVYDDFSKKTGQQAGWEIENSRKPVVAVIKKEINTLKALHRWLKDLNAKGEGRISGTPMLLIDDEADYASINTNKPGQDPTQINHWIRNILELFSKASYVGYTATPFANIFISPDPDSKGLPDLFPKDFIYSLEAPSNYFGPDKIFSDTEEEHTEGNQDSQWLQPIPETDDVYIPLQHKKDYQPSKLPPSLSLAIRQFVIVRAMRELRGQRDQHCSMLVNVSRFINVQEIVNQIVYEYVADLRYAVKARSRLSENDAMQDRYMKDLHATFLDGFSDLEFQWPKIQTALLSGIESIDVSLINSRSSDALNYERYQDGKGMTVIAIGGLNLSRGLTLEGLCVSYMYRNSRMYDTLMQMGRWFGYRARYEDLCRIHLPQSSIDYYSYITRASEELREQIRDMSRRGMSPKEFGLYVRKHPANLMITSLGKMRAAEDKYISWSGRAIESHKLPRDEGINQHNKELIKNYWEDGFNGSDPEKERVGWLRRDVPTDKVINFLEEFRCHADFDESKRNAHQYLSVICEDYPYTDVLLASSGGEHGNTSTIYIGDQLIGARVREAKFSDCRWSVNKARVGSPGDERAGLRRAQKEKADASGTANALRYRNLRNKPFLVLSLLDLKDSDINYKEKSVPAFVISFPHKDDALPIKVRVNQTFAKQLLIELNDPGDGDD